MRSRPKKVPLPTQGLRLPLPDIPAMNNPTAKFTLPRSMIGILVIFGLMGAVLFAARHKDYPNLHIILDTGLFLLSGILALLLWDMGERLNNSFSKHLAVSFAVTAMLNLIHVLVTVEWSGPLLPIAQSANVLRPGTWPPSVHVLPIGVGCSIWLMRRNRHNARTLALVLFALSAGLLVLFNWLPRYLPPGWLGITRPTLILSPMLWAVVGWECWRLRAKDRLLPMLAMMSVVLLLANIVMLYSRAPHDTQAMVAHLCRVCGHLILLVLLMRMASSDMFERIQAEQRLAGLNEELEQRVLDRTRQLESINKSLESEMAVRRQAEVARQASEARYHTLFEYAPDGIVIVDSKGYYLDVNASICRMLGYTRDEFIGLNATDIVAPAEIPHIEQALDVIKNKSDYQREWQFRRKDGSVFSVDTIATAMPDGNLLALIRDITERKQAEAKIHQLNIELEQRVIERTAELEAANKELEAFSYSVSHDLRAPLRAVDGFSQVVEEDYGSQLPKEGQRYLRMIREGAQRMGVLIDDLLTFSRLSRAHRDRTCGEYSEAGARCHGRAKSPAARATD